jgi:hypothetical protein
MPIQSSLKTRDYQHVRRYSDAVMIASMGVSWSKVSEALGYAHSSSLGRKLNKYKEGDQYLPLHLSCLVESALWRMGKMQTYITMRRLQEGADSVSWEMLPRHFYSH